MNDWLRLFSAGLVIAWAGLAVGQSVDPSGDLSVDGQVAEVNVEPAGPEHSTPFNRTGSAGSTPRRATGLAAATALRVAVFEGPGVSENSVAALLHDLKQDAGLSVHRISPARIIAGQLSEYDVVVFPGGSGGGQGKALTTAGRQQVRTFITDGGGFVGICAGAYLASADYEWSLHVLDAKVLDRQHWARGFGDVNLSVQREGAECLRLPQSNAAVYYHQGPLLTPAERPEIPDYQEWATFATEVHKEGVPGGVMVGTTAVAAGRFGHGRVLAISPHPEKTAGLDHVLPRAVHWAAAGQERILPPAP